MAVEENWLLGRPAQKDGSGMRAFLLLSALSEPSDRPDIVCGTRTSPGAWIDLPTFWINLESNRARADAMRAQLAVALLPGACATRVPAVHTSMIWRFTSGTALLREEGGGLFRGQWPSEAQQVSVREVEIAVMASHLRAIHAGAAAGAPAFLVLEDDAMITGALSRESLHPTQRAAFYASALARAMPLGWSMGALNVIAFKRVWLRMRALWNATMAERRRRRRSLDVQHVARSNLSSPVVAIDPVLLQGEREREAGCPAQLWGAGAYLTSAQGAATVLRLWSVIDLHPHDSATSLAVDFSRVCWSFPHQSRACKRNVPRLVRPMVNLHADVCLLYHTAAGPALDFATAASVRDNKTLLDLRAKAADRGEALRTFVLTPPPVIQGRVGKEMMSHPETADLHEWSRYSSHRFWDALVADAG